MSPTTTLQPDERVPRPLTLLEHPAPTASDRALFEYFRDARARARGPIVCVNARVMFSNAAAVGLVQRSDLNALWAWARRALDDGDRSVHVLRLRDRALSAQCEGVVAGSEMVGAVIRLGTSARVATRTRSRRAPKPARRSFGWESLRESELGVAQLVAEGLTNREIDARLFVSRHTVDFHLRQIFRKLDISSRVELTRLVVERSRIGDASAA
jgi:DNA-binding CsgD family transcriptional regulator